MWLCELDVIVVDDEHRDVRADGTRNDSGWLSLGTSPSSMRKIWNSSSDHFVGLIYCRISRLYDTKLFYSANSSLMCVVVMLNPESICKNIYALLYS